MRVNYFMRGSRTICPTLTNKMEESGNRAEGGGKKRMILSSKQQPTDGLTLTPQRFRSSEVPVAINRTRIMAAPFIAQQPQTMSKDQ